MNLNDMERVVNMKKKKVPMLIIDDSRYRVEPVNRNPNSTIIKMTPEIQKEKDKIEKKFKF